MLIYVTTSQEKPDLNTNLQGIWDEPYVYGVGLDLIC